MDNKTTQNNRKHLRYQPNPELAAFLECCDSKKEGPFHKDMSALVVSESHGGCALVVQGTDMIKLGALCRVMLVPGGVRNGKISWLKMLDEELMKVGIQLDC